MISPYTQGYYDGYTDLSDKLYWYDKAEDKIEYLIGVRAGRLDALLEVNKHNERHTHA